MSKDVVGSMPKGTSEWDSAWNGALGDEAAQLPPAEISVERSAAARANLEQLERDFAEIERATAALRRAEPALEAWTDRPSEHARKPPSIWVLVGALWLSTAIVTAGAVAAIAALVG